MKSRYKVKKIKNTCKYDYLAWRAYYVNRLSTVHMHVWKKYYRATIFFFNLFLTIEIIKLFFNWLIFRWIRGVIIPRISFHIGHELSAYFLYSNQNHPIYNNYENLPHWKCMVFFFTLVYYVYFKTKFVISQKASLVGFCSLTFSRCMH